MDASNIGESTASNFSYNDEKNHGGASNHSMTTLSEKNEDLEAGEGSPSPLKIRRRRHPEKQSNG